MAVRVNAYRMARRYVSRLERERQEWLEVPDEELGMEPGWRQGFCEGLRAAQVLIRKG